MQLAKNTLFQRTLDPSKAGAAVAAGSSYVDGVTGASVDTADFEGALFIQGVIGGGTGGAISFIVQQSSAALAAGSSAGQGTTLLGTTSTIAAGSSATGETFVVDVYRPRRTSSQRFLNGQLTVASSCAVIGQQYVIQYEGRAWNNSTGTSQNTTANQNGVTGGVVASVSPST